MDAMIVINKFKDKVVPLAVIGFALFFALKIYNAQKSELGKLKEEADVELKKNQSLTEISGYEEDFTTIKHLVNSKDIALTLDILGSLAKNAEVKIVGIKPQSVKELSQYNLYGFDLNLTARSFHAIGKFLDLLEDNKNIYFVDTMVLSSDAQMYEAGSFEIKVDLRVSTILIKD